MNKKLILANKCYVSVDQNDKLVEVVYPANKLIRPIQPESRELYTYDIGIYGINNVTSIVPNYVVRILTYLSIQFKTLSRGLDKSLILNVQNDFNTLKLDDLLFPIEDINLEKLVRKNIDNIARNQLDSIPEEIQEGGQLIFNCFYKGDLNV
jgi:hypothetical protein